MGGGGATESALETAARASLPLLLPKVITADIGAFLDCDNDVHLGNLLPVSVLHMWNASTGQTASTNRRIRYAKVAPNLSHSLQEYLVEQGVDTVLQRPLTEWMTLPTLLSLVRSGRCRSRCYAKSVPLDLYYPHLLHTLRPLRLQVAGLTLPIGAANLWLGGTARGVAVLTDLHKDDRPNVLAVLRGRKHVMVIPPSDEPRLRELTMLDVQSALREGGEREKMESSQPQLPTRTEDVLLDRQHHALGFEELSEHLRMRKTTRELVSMEGKLASICSYILEAGDALFIPPGWPHAVETSADNDWSAAVNYFYDYLPRDQVCRTLGRGVWRLVGREIFCG